MRPNCLIDSIFSFESAFRQRKILIYPGAFFTPNYIASKMSNLIKLVEQANVADRRSTIPAFKAGDTINVHVRITEGTKERIQQFQGVVLQRKNPNTNGETFTVRKISNGVGVERIFPVLSPSIDKIEVVRRGVVRRARLFYLRGLSGKASRIKERKA